MCLYFQKQLKEEQESSDEDESESGRDKKWDILRDDYMMGAKMKDWDKEGSEDDDEGPGDPDMSDSD